MFFALTSVGGPEEGTARRAARGLQADGAPCGLERLTRRFSSQDPTPHSIRPAKEFTLLREHMIPNGPELEVPRQLPARLTSSQAEAVHFSGSLHGARSGEGWGHRCPVPPLQRSWSPRRWPCWAAEHMCPFLLCSPGKPMFLVGLLSIQLARFVCVLSESANSQSFHFSIPSASGHFPPRFPWDSLMSCHSLSLLVNVCE